MTLPTDAETPCCRGKEWLSWVAPRWQRSVAFLLVAVCSSCKSESGDLQGRTTGDSPGDTIAIQTSANGIWTQAKTLVPELTIAGANAGSGQTLGQIAAVAIDSLSGVYIFDATGPSIRYFASNGRYVRTVGSQGRGPGQYDKRTIGLVIRPDGRLMFGDPLNTRLILFRPDGAVSEEWAVEGMVVTTQGLTVDTGGHSYLKILAGSPKPGQLFPVGLLHLDGAGLVVDTVHPPALLGEPTRPGGPFDPWKVWAMSHHGHLVVGLNDHYRFDILAPGGLVYRIERLWQPTPLNEEERDEWEEARLWQEEQGKLLGRSVNLPPTPRTKPAYRAFLFGLDGRIWVQRFTTAIKVKTDEPQQGAAGQFPRISWLEPEVYDVFETDGTYLGEVQVPLGTRIVAIQRDRLWGVSVNHDKSQVLVRFRMVP